MRKIVVILLLIIFSFIGYSQNYSIWFDMPDTNTSVLPKAFPANTLFYVTSLKEMYISDTVLSSGTTLRYWYDLGHLFKFDFKDTTLWKRTEGHIYPKIITDSVGIGTATPSEPLEVNGDMKINDDYIYDNRISFGDAHNNLIIGKNAGTNITTEFGDVILGNNANNAANTRYVTATGYNCLKNNTSMYSTFYGALAAQTVDITTASTGFGFAVADSATTVNYFTGIGYAAARDAQVLDRTVLAGYAAGGHRDTIRYTVDLGHEADMGLKRGTSLNNVVIGMYAGRFSVNNSDNVYIGNQSVEYDSTGGNKNVVLGSWAFAETTPNCNVAIGYKSGYRNLGYTTTQDSCILIGNMSGAAIADTVNNLFVLANDSIPSHTLMRGIIDGKNSLKINTKTFEIYDVADDVTLMNFNGVKNVSIGYDAMGMPHPTAGGDIAIGYQALTSQNNGYYNIAIGYIAGSSITNGHDNVMIGKSAGALATSVYNNVAIGTSAGYRMGSYNVMIGYQAGLNESGSNKLYIDNSSTATPLIYGDFANDSLVINSKLKTQYFYQTQPTGSLTDGAPTAAEINAILGSAATAGAGYKVTVKDSDGSGLLYIIESDGTDWYYIVTTKAL